MERLGLGPDVLPRPQSAPRLRTMTGWGQEGPLAERAGHDIDNRDHWRIPCHRARGGSPRAATQPRGGLWGGGRVLAFGMLCAPQAGVNGSGQVVDAAMVDGAACS